MQKEYRIGYSSDVNDDELSVCGAPYLTLCREDAAQ